MKFSAFVNYEFLWGGFSPMFFPSNCKLTDSQFIEGGEKKSRQAQKIANSKKSTILLQSL